MVRPVLFDKIGNMNRQKIQEKSSIHLAFHVPDDVAANKRIIGMKETLEEVFHQHHLLEENQYVEELGVIEFIYRVDCPVLMSQDTLQAFFHDLMKVFTTLSVLNPHFTQFDATQRRDT